MIKTIITVLALAISTASSAGDFVSSLVFDVRAGYSIGGTAPVGLPSSIRELNSYKLTPSFRIGADARGSFSDRWGLMAGLRLENKGMNEDARVKNYHMAIVRGGQELEGRYFGDVETRVSEWMFTLPVQATLALGRFTLKCGPYVSVLLSRSFKGNAHDGYLRVGDPTGAKVIMGNESDTRGHYDFSSHMRRMQWGADVGAEYFFSGKTGVSADLSWGLSGVHHSNFKTIEQTLYPIYGTIGIVHKLK